MTHALKNLSLSPFSFSGFAFTVLWLYTLPWGQLSQEYKQNISLWRAISPDLYSETSLSLFQTVIQSFAWCLSNQTWPLSFGIFLYLLTCTHLFLCLLCTFSASLIMEKINHCIHVIISQSTLFSLSLPCSTKRSKQWSAPASQTCLASTPSCCHLTCSSRLRTTPWMPCSRVKMLLLPPVTKSISTMPPCYYSGILYSMRIWWRCEFVLYFF